MSIPSQSFSQFWSVDVLEEYLDIFRALTKMRSYGTRCFVGAPYQFTPPSPSLHHHSVPQITPPPGYIPLRAPPPTFSPLHGGVVKWGSGKREGDVSEKVSAGRAEGGCKCGVCVNWSDEKGRQGELNWIKE